MKRRRFTRYVGVAVAAMIGTLSGLNYVRPLPAATANAATLSAYIGTPAVAWPALGEAAYGAVGYGVLAASSPQGKMPTASVAKIITALAVLKARPLRPGEQGPELTITPADTALYNKYASEDGSTVRVVAGEQLSEYQALEAMLVPSANNVADTLAAWAYGSLSAYKTAATDYVNGLGLKSTVLGSDASGFSPDTQSTPSDLVVLGEAALGNPVIAAIVGEPSVSLPVVGTVKNANADLGADGMIGIKVGNNDQDHGAFLFAARHAVGNGQSETIVGALLGQPSLKSALDAALPLLNSVEATFAVETPIAAGQPLATYTMANGQNITAAAQTSLSIAAWQGAATLPHLDLHSLQGPLASGAVVGTVSLDAGANHVSAPVVLKAGIPAPSFWQRLWRL